MGMWVDFEAPGSVCPPSFPTRSRRCPTPPPIYGEATGCGFWAPSWMAALVIEVKLQRFD